MGADARRTVVDTALNGTFVCAREFGRRHLGRPGLVSSMEDELIYQTFINKSDDYAELRAAHAEGRDPVFKGS
jgi:hypothetical protein